MESWCPPPPAHGSNPHPSSPGPGHYVGDSGDSDACHDWLPGCPGWTGGGAGQGGEQRIGPGYYRLTGSSLTRTTRAVRQTYRSPLGGDCGGRLLALGACPQQIKDMIKDLDGSNLPVWAPFAVLGGLIAAPLIPEVAGPVFEGIFGAAAEGAGDASSVDEVLSGLRAGRTPPNLEVNTPTELNRVFDELTENAKAVQSNNYPGKFVELQDGTRVGLRAGSRSGGPTIDVFKPDGTYVKVHLP